MNSRRQFRTLAIVFSTKEDVLLLIGKAKYNFVLRGERRTFWMQNSKTVSEMNFVRQTTVPHTNVVHE